MPVYTLLAMEYRELFAKRLKEARVARGFTQDRLAQLSGVHANAIAKYETMVIIPSVETLKKLAEALEVSADYFVFDQATMEGVPKINDPALFSKYFELESLDADERAAALTVLNALLTSHKLRALTSSTEQAPPPTPKKTNHKEATA